MKTLLLAALVCLALSQVAGCPALVEEDTVPGARVTTSEGEFLIALHDEQAPVTTANFQQYAQDNFYDGTIFHRVIADYVVQGGGLTPALNQKPTRAAIINESNNGLSNVRGTVAMARTPNDPDSARAQFFINLADNTDLDATENESGYTVFGAVIEGMDVVDRIGAIPTVSRDGLDDVPSITVVIEDVELVTVPTGQLDVTDVGAQYQYRALVAVRRVVVDMLAAFLPALVGG